jgi:hypothetical protein
MNAKLRRIVENVVRDELSLPSAIAISKLPSLVPQRGNGVTWDMEIFIGDIRPKRGGYYTDAIEWVKAIISPPTQSSLGKRISRGFAKSGLAYLFLERDRLLTKKGDKGSPKQPKSNDSADTVDENLVRDQAASFIRDMWACLWAEERFWKLLKVESPPEKIAEFITRHYFLILPVASAAVWRELAANQPLLRSLVEALPSHPERLCGWVPTNATRNLAGRIRRPEFGRVAARYVSSPDTVNKELSRLNYSGPQYLLLADALRKMADDALACAEQTEAPGRVSFSPPVKRRIPSREQAEKIEKFAVVIKRSPGETDTFLARRSLQERGKTEKAMKNMLPSVRSDISRARRLLKLRHWSSKMKRR